MSLTDWLLPTEGRLLPADLELLTRLAQLLPAEWRAALVDPSRAERRALPRFEALTAKQGALRFAHYDLLIAARLPSSAAAARLLRAARRSCRLLVVLTAKPSSEAPHDGLFASLPFAGGELRLERGELADPLLRVDDYPTGVRPILEDLTPLHEVLQRIDDSGLAFHLGIVPAIIEDRMEGFLRSLRHLVVAQHGFEHGYAKLSRVLLDAGDPFNQRGTVGGFDEFAGSSYDEILSTLTRGRSLLEARTGQLATSYIPPTNRASRRTGRALTALGFEYVLSERAIPGCPLPCIGSDFYDRSPAFRPEAGARVVSLHATWEADLQREGDRASLARLLAALVEQRARSREQVAAAAHELERGLERG